MLPRANRLVSDFDYRRVRRGGRQISNRYFSLFVLREKTNRPSRFGFVVSARIDKRATKRNRLRRLLREEVRGLLPSVQPGYSAAFWLRSAALTEKPAKLREAVREALKLAGVL